MILFLALMIVSKVRENEGCELKRGEVDVRRVCTMNLMKAKVEVVAQLVLEGWFARTRATKARERFVIAHLK